MNKTELIKHAATQAQLTRGTMTTALDAILKTIRESLEREERVMLRDFGTFLRKERKARRGFHPSTQKLIEIPAKSIIGFKASKRK